MKCVGVQEPLEHSPHVNPAAPLYLQDGQEETNAVFISLIDSMLLTLQEDTIHSSLVYFGVFSVPGSPRCNGGAV